MAYRAGAELTGFEYTLNYYIIKDINAPLLYITLTRGAHLLTAMDVHLEDSHPSIKSMICAVSKTLPPFTPVAKITAHRQALTCSTTSRICLKKYPRPC